VVLVESDLGGVQIADRVLEFGEPGLRRGGPIPGVGDRRGQSGDLVTAGRLT